MIDISSLIYIVFENYCFGTRFIYQSLWVWLLWVCIYRKDLGGWTQSNFWVTKFEDEICRVNELIKINTTWQASRKSATWPSLSIPVLFFQKITDILYFKKEKKTPLETIKETLYPAKTQILCGMYVRVSFDSSLMIDINNWLQKSVLSPYGFRILLNIASQIHEQLISIQRWWGSKTWGILICSSQ